jgi:hypothetical protein
VVKNICCPNDIKRKKINKWFIQQNSTNEPNNLLSMKE